MSRQFFYPGTQVLQGLLHPVRQRLAVNSPAVDGQHDSAQHACQLDAGRDVCRVCKVSSRGRTFEFWTIGRQVDLYLFGVDRVWVAKVGGTQPVEVVCCPPNTDSVFSGRGVLELTRWNIEMQTHDDGQAHCRPGQGIGGVPAVKGQGKVHQQQPELYLRYAGPLADDTKHPRRPGKVLDAGKGPRRTAAVHFSNGEEHPELAPGDRVAAARDAILKNLNDGAPANDVVVPANVAQCDVDEEPGAGGSRPRAVCIRQGQEAFVGGEADAGDVTMMLAAEESLAEARSEDGIRCLVDQYGALRAEFDEPRSFIDRGCLRGAGARAGSFPGAVRPY